jgi:succinate dehydrogenase (ubiquinone) iron-sulfur subunit
MYDLSFAALCAVSLCLQEFQVYRWSPDAPEQPKYVSYKVDINACGPMMLDVLLKIKDEMDQSLAFRRSCRWAMRSSSSRSRS